MSRPLRTVTSNAADLLSTETLEVAQSCKCFSANPRVVKHFGDAPGCSTTFSTLDAVYRHRRKHAKEGGCVGAEVRKLAECEARLAHLKTKGQLWWECTEERCKYFIDSANRDRSKLKKQHLNTHEADIVMLPCKFPRCTAEFTNVGNRWAHEHTPQLPGGRYYDVHQPTDE